MDTMSAFMYSYSYCKSSDECLGDAWNFYNKWCASGWQAGWTLDVYEDCEALTSIGVCQPFVGKETLYGRYINDTNRRLEPGAACTVQVDATAAVSRVIFEDSTGSLGVLVNGYRVGDVITVPEGNTRNVTIYNGDRGGYLRFTLSFSGAVNLAASMTLAGASAILS